MDDFSQLLQIELESMSRRLRGMAMISRGIVPNLVISDLVIARIANTASQYIEDETGEALVGLILKENDDPECMPTIYVLDTISPDESAIRRSHTFQQGDELQQDIFVWLYENWETYREKRVDSAGKNLDEKFNVPLLHLGDWHKQPGYMIQPSGGDLITALAIMDDDDNDFDFLLVPIVTLGHPATTLEIDAQVNYFTIPMDDGTDMRVDWWYIHRDVRVFQPITPVVVSRGQLPSLTPYPWHLLDEERLNEEVARLNADGLFVSIVVWEADGDLPLEICFMTARQGSSQVILIVTDWNYPLARPQARVAPFLKFESGSDMYDVFGQLWEHSQPIEAPEGWQWHRDRYLADYVALIEQQLDIRPDKTAPTASASRQRTKNLSVKEPVETSED